MRSSAGFGLVGPLTRTKINEAFGKKIAQSLSIVPPSSTISAISATSATSTTEQPIINVQSQTINPQQISEIKEQIKQLQALLVSLLQQLVGYSKLCAKFL